MKCLHLPSDSGTRLFELILSIRACTQDGSLVADTTFISVSFFGGSIEGTSGDTSVSPYSKTIQLIITYTDMFSRKIFPIYGFLCVGFCVPSGLRPLGG